eukprot:CAMPEP_0181139184 /NCGR_PEP_ID=MMETSP1071-20121207/34649_1 /TAXON_ID=35127 /ORGANISM="Thalassiosira sp., Strain NH16" /LENGTH=98 /DNA_ID=CAMNT_0023226079 /DNA_START=71 /DNA_END=367 /DNA_ORIENTATION=-
MSSPQPTISLKRTADEANNNDDPSTTTTTTTRRSARGGGGGIGFKSPTSEIKRKSAASALANLFSTGSDDNDNDNDDVLENNKTKNQDDLQQLHQHRT